MKDHVGRPVYESKEIVETFRQYYQKLYDSYFTADPLELKHYLDSIELYWVDAGLREPLNAPITLEEILEAIKELPTTKAPGPDGLTGEFYKHFANLLAPILLQVYDEALEKELPSTLYMANIILLHKPDKPKDERASYRPISHKP